MMHLHLHLHLSGIILLCLTIASQCVLSTNFAARSLRTHSPIVKNNVPEFPVADPNVSPVVPGLPASSVAPVASWPNLKFMQTFFYNSKPIHKLNVHPHASKVPINSFTLHAPSVVRPPNEVPARESDTSASASPAMVASSGPLATTPAMSTASPAAPAPSYFDWNRLRSRLSSVLSLEANTSTAVLPTNALSSSFVPADGHASEDTPPKNDDSSASSTGIGGYLTSLWSGSSGGSSSSSSSSSSMDSSNNQRLSVHNVISKDVSVNTLADVKSSLTGPTASSLDITPHQHELLPSFYQDPVLIASGSIKSFVCDKTMAIVRSDSNESQSLVDCELFDLDKRKREADELLRKLNMNAQEIKFELMMSLIEQCRQLSERQASTHKFGQSSQWEMSQVNAAGLPLSSSDNKTSSLIWSGLVPGTYWCGLGDSAKHYNDLGPRQDIDICCRAHDHCPIRLKSFRPGYGLFNLSFYTKSHCKCDRDFYQCLRKTNNRVSDMIGNVFFNVLKVQCIDEEHPCLQYKEIDGKQKCLKYKTIMQIKQPESKY